MTFKNLLTLSTIIFLFSVRSFACPEASLFKIFPVGIYDNQIISVDIKIQRTSIYTAKWYYGLKIKNDTLVDEMTLAWKLKTYITQYNFAQKPLKVIDLDSVVLAGADYSKALQKLYQSALKKIKQDYKGIELFKINYLSFCDYQQDCNQLSVKYDTLQEKSFGLYNNKKYHLKVFHNKKTFETNENSFELNVQVLSINSVRIYTTQGTKVVVGHLQTGHELAMGWIKTDGSPKTEIYHRIPIEKETDLAKRNLSNITYQEPLLHHGYGFDVFFMVEK